MKLVRSELGIEPYDFMDYTFVLDLPGARQLENRVVEAAELVEDADRNSKDVEEALATGADHILLDNMTPEQVAYWDGLMAKVSREDEWLKELDQNALTPAYMNSEATRKLFAQQADTLRGILADLGLAK